MTTILTILDCAIEATEAVEAAEDSDITQYVKCKPFLFF